MAQTALVPPPAEAPAPGPLSILMDLFVAPAEAFGAIARQPRILVPLVLLVALNLAFTTVWLSQLDVAEFMREQLAASGRELTAEQAAEAVALQERIMRPLAYVGAVVGAPLFVAAVAAIFLMAFRFAGSTELAFKASAAVVAWSFLAVSLVQTPLTLLVLALQGNWNVNPQEALQASLALIMDRDDTPKALLALGGSLDLFSFWLMYLLAAGYAACTRRSLSGALPLVVVAWAVWVLGKVVVALITS